MNKPIKPFNPDEVIKDWQVPMNAQQMGGQLGVGGAIAGGLQSLAFLVANQNQANRRALQAAGINEATANIYAALPAALGHIADGTDDGGILDSIRSNLANTPEKFRNEINKTLTAAIDDARKNREKASEKARQRSGLITGQQIISTLESIPDGEGDPATLKYLSKQWMENRPNLSDSDLKTENEKFLKQMGRLNAEDIAKNDDAQLKLDLKNTESAYRPLQKALKNGDDIDPKSMEKLTAELDKLPAFHPEKKRIYGIITDWEIKRGVGSADAELTSNEKKEKITKLGDMQTKLSTGELQPTEKTWQDYAETYSGLSTTDISAAVRWKREWLIEQDELKKQQQAEASAPIVIEKTGGEIFTDFDSGLSNYLSLRGDGQSSQAESALEYIQGIIKGLKNESTARQYSQILKTAVKNQDKDIQSQTIKNALNKFDNKVLNAANKNATAENRWDIINKIIQLATDGLPDETAIKIKQKLEKTATDVFDNEDKKQQEQAIKATRNTASDNIMAAANNTLLAARNGQDYSGHLLSLSDQVRDWDKNYNNSVPSTFTSNLLKDTSEKTIQIMMSRALDDGGLNALLAMQEKLESSDLMVQYRDFIDQTAQGLIDMQNQITAEQEKQAEAEAFRRDPQGLVGEANDLVNRLGDGNLSTEGKFKTFQKENWTTLSDADKDAFKLYADTNSWNSTKNIYTVSRGFKTLNESFGAVYAGDNITYSAALTSDQNKMKSLHIARMVYKNAIWNMSPEQRNNDTYVSFVAMAIADHITTFSSLLSDLGTDFSTLTEGDGADYKAQLEKTKNSISEEKNAKAILLYTNVLNNADMVYGWIKNVKEELNYGKR